MWVRGGEGGADPLPPSLPHVLHEDVHTVNVRLKGRPTLTKIMEQTDSLTRSNVNNLTVNDGLTGTL